MATNNGWIGVDLDGTLAFYGKWVDWKTIGQPIPKMVSRVKKWLAEGKEVRIVTARVAFEENDCYVTGVKFTRQQIKTLIEDYCEKHLGRRLPVTHEKDYLMIELWDDRCVQVIPNTGQRADGKP